MALGHLAKFTCEIHTAPNVRFQWFKGGKEIYESDKCSIRSANYVTTLEILRTQVVDCGEYTCKASNEYGSVSCTATLTVTGKCQAMSWMQSPHLTLLLTLLSIQVQEMLPAGDTNNQDGNMVARDYQAYVGKESFCMVLFLSVGKEKNSLHYAIKWHDH